MAPNNYCLQKNAVQVHIEKIPLFRDEIALYTQVCCRASYYVATHTHKVSCTVGVYVESGAHSSVSQSVVIPFEILEESVIDPTAIVDAAYVIGVYFLHCHIPCAVQRISLK